MRTDCKTFYRYSELSDDAKELATRFGRANRDWTGSDQDLWLEDAYPEWMADKGRPDIESVLRCGGRGDRQSLSRRLRRIRPRLLRRGPGRMTGAQRSRGVRCRRRVGSVTLPDSHLSSPLACACAHHSDGSVTRFLCSAHADADPCATTAAVTGRRRKGSVVRGTCTTCGWQTPVVP